MSSGKLSGFLYGYCKRQMVCVVVPPVHTLYFEKKPKAIEHLFKHYKFSLIGSCDEITC